MTPQDQESKRLKDLAITFINALNPLKTADNPDNINTETDVRYFHSLSENFHSEYIPKGFVNEDLNDIQGMTEAELDLELSALGYDEGLIDENTAILTSENIFSFSKLAERSLDLEVERECMFQSKVMSVLINEALYKSITLSRENPPTLAYSQEVANTYVNDNSKPDIKTTENDIRFIEHRDKLALEATQRSLFKKANIGFGMAASLVALAIAFSPGLTPPEIIANNSLKAGQIASIEAKTRGPIHTVSNVVGSHKKQISLAAVDAKVTEKNISIEQSILAFRAKDSAAYGISNQSASAPLTMSRLLYSEEMNISNVAKTIKGIKSNAISESPLEYEEAMTLLNKLINGEVNANGIEHLKLIQKLQQIVNKDLLNTSKTCAEVGTYKHVVAPNESLSKIIDDCAYRFADSNIFKIKLVLQEHDIVTMNVDDDRFIKRIELEKLDGSKANIYNFNKPNSVDKLGLRKEAH